jgi:hypothetical protein
MQIDADEEGRGFAQEETEEAEEYLMNFMPLRSLLPPVRYLLDSRKTRGGTRPATG